jgi:signal transduction histidine kinase
MVDLETSEKMEALVNLAGTMAHELNNIFTAVAGNLSLLDPSDIQEDQSAATIRDIVRAAQRGIDLTAKLQAFAGRQLLRRKKTDINNLILETICPLQDTWLAAVDVRLKLADVECTIYTDEEKFCDTITELSRNAQAAMPKGGVLTIETLVQSAVVAGAPAPRQFVTLRITDSGIGMEPDVAARAIEPLFSTRRAGVNTGWGLSGCAGFIRQCGGRMTIYSRPGQGTRVEIRFPLDI